ncbi:MAG: ribonuclease III, partial [Abditibacteriota bacterium]|nr:ribonuclease III [Abditibacteriota bacterium]
MSCAKELTQILSERTGIALEDSSWLELCLVHKSYAFENPGSGHNERLEFLGDSIIGEIVSRWLFEKYPQSPEGELTKMKSTVVCEKSLAAAALRLGLDRLLVVGESEKDTGLSARPSIMCNTFEALCAAIYLSAGRAAAEAFVLGQLEDELRNAQSAYGATDPKSCLQTLLQEKFRAAPVYKVVRESGPAHNKTFGVSVYFNGRRLADGQGKSKKAAEKQAAEAAALAVKREFDTVYDVFVAGAGLSGVCAAVSAARAGARVAVCDVLPGPGGLATYGLVNPFMTHKTSDGRPLIGGLFEEVKDRLRKKGGIRENCFDAGAMKEVLTEMLLENDSITFLPEDPFKYASRYANGYFAVALEKRFVNCRRIIDATGDGVCAQGLGAEAELGDRNGNIQAATLMFDVAGVDIKKALGYAKSHPEDFLFPKYPPDTDLEEA